MGDGGKGCLKGCGLGCGAALLIGIGFIVLASVAVVGPLREAHEARVQLDEQHGAQDAYTPAADGMVPGSRVETFLEVREALRETCDRITSAAAEVKKIESFDDQDDVSKVEVMSQALRTSGAVMGVGGLLGDLYKTRNESLLVSGMGLGEYTYIYVVVYGERLRDPRSSEELFNGPPVNRRVRADLLAMLERQHELLVNEESFEELRVQVEHEIVAMNQDPGRLLWQDGLPAEIASALQPFRSRLDESFCAASVELELLQNKPRFLGIESY